MSIIAIADLQLVGVRFRRRREHGGEGPAVAPWAKQAVVDAAKPPEERAPAWSQKPAPVVEEPAPPPPPPVKPESPPQQQHHTQEERDQLVRDCEAPTHLERFPTSSPPHTSRTPTSEAEGAMEVGFSSGCSRVLTEKIFLRRLASVPSETYG